MTVSGSWVEAVVAAGAVPASHVPDASLGRSDVEEFTGADPVEAAELHTYPLGDAPPLAPGAVCFLDGIEQWRVVGYGGVTPHARADAPPPLRRGRPGRRLRPAAAAPQAGAMTPRGSQSLAAARAGSRARHLLLVRAAGAVGGKQSAVRSAAPRSPRPSRHPGARRAHRGLGAGAAGAYRHARPALGSITLSYPRRGDVPEGTRPVRPHLASRISHPVSRLSASDDRLVIERRHLAPPIGRVVATEQKPATPHQFHFWTANETSIGIGAIVRVEEAGNGKGETGKVVYGVVTDGFAYSDLATPLHDVVGAQGDPAKAAESPTVRQEIRLWTAAVLRQTPEEPLQPVPLGEVHVASDVDVAQALRMDTYLGGAQPTAIPVGLYTSGGLEAPVYLDADFLLGPEAAHLNISGVSGLATKTSAVEFLLGSIFQHFPSHKGRVAAVGFY